MTVKLYWQDAHLKEFDAKVIAVDGNQLVLDKTAFYPTSGGQLADIGEVDGEKVLDVVESDENVFHILEKEPSFKVGDTVHGKINWDRRYAMMRLHSAAHVISAVLIKNFGNIMFTGSQIYEDRTRMDFNIEKLDEETAKVVEEKSNEVVRMGLPITARIITKEEVEANPNLFRLMDTSHYQGFKVFRVVEIKDLDVQLDGGTHVRNTEEIGKIRIVKRENKGKNNRRITIRVE